MIHHPEVKARLDARRRTLLARAGRIESDLRKEHERDWAEQATQLENDEVLEGLDAMGRAEVLAVDRALQRLNDGGYGRCERCGGDIEERRLAAVPTAATCVRCANWRTRSTREVL